MSDELIGAFDIRGTRESGLTVECAWNVGKAMAEFLPTLGDVAVMTDPLQKEIANAVVEGLRLQGRTVVDGGNGDKDAARSYIKTAQLAGAVVVGYDELEAMTTIELYREDGLLIDSQSGLHTIRDLVEAGNFVPAAEKGELTHFA